MDLNPKNMMNKPRIPIKPKLSILTFSFLIFLIVLSSCKKEKDAIDQNEITIDGTYNYDIELDSNYKIISVLISQPDYPGIGEFKYEYYKDSVVRTENAGYETWKKVYYLNKSGLADSSIFTSCCYDHAQTYRPVYYHYDPDGYLIMAIEFENEKPDTTFYTYDIGNLNDIVYSGGVFGVYFPTEIEYTYSNLKNVIDIEFFNGSFLGNLNQNLIASRKKYGSPEGIYRSTFKYTLRADGLVVESIEYITVSTDKTTIAHKYNYKFTEPE